MTPPMKTIRVYRPSGTEQTFKAGDEINGEDVLPGLHLPVGPLFDPPPSDQPLS